MEQKDQAQTYEKPQVVDYGTLVELTAGLGSGRHEDGLHKGHDPSHPHRP